ncbi:MAG: DHHW family protein [Turicibacter sp.]|nr:DHHW family protein [Turicibacter sp.]
MTKKADFLVNAIFLPFILILALANALSPDEAISELENRSLQQLPVFSWERVQSGAFMKDFETYMTDQFIGKPWWVGLKSDVQRLVLGQRENNGIYFGDNDFLLEAFLDEGRHFDRNLELLNAFGERLPNLPVTIMLVPTAVKVFEHYLPPFAPVLDQSLLIERAKSMLRLPFLDVYGTLSEHTQDYIYFRTDHHWTMRGAYLAYLELMQAWGMEPYTDYQLQTVSDNFFGTYFAQANNFRIPPDSIEVFVPNRELQLTLQRSGDDTPREGIFASEFLQKRDQYSFFLGGVDGLMVIRGNAGTGKKLLVIKDSYAHNFVPFLTQHFDEIHLIDLRFYNQPLYPYIESTGFDQALFLYNLSSFGGDPSLIRIEGG